MVIVISIHQVADKSVNWKQAAQATQFGAIWLQLIGQEVWQKLSYFFDQLLKPHKSLRNPPHLVCSRNDYILWYKFQKFKKCVKILGYALVLEQHCQFSPFGPIFEVNGLDWHCYLASSSKMAPRILIVSIAIGANYSNMVINSEILELAFF